MANLIGSGINQISVNGMLGNLAFQDKSYVNVDAIGIGTTFVDSGTVGQVLQVSGGAYVSGNLGVGNTNPTYNLHIIGTADPAGMFFDAYGNVAANIAGRRANGTVASPTGVITNDNLLVLQGTGYAGTTFASAKTAIFMQASEVWTSTAQGTHIDFATTLPGTTTRSNKLRIDGYGNLLVGTGTSTGTASQPLQVTGGAYVSGSLGIGVTNPQAKLHVAGSGSINTGTTIAVFNNSSDQTRISIVDENVTGLKPPGVRSPAASYGLGLYAPGGPIRFYPSDIEYARFDGSGNLLLNSTTATGTASQPLQVSGGAYVSGNLGVGNTNPTSKLHVQGDARFVTGSQGDVTITHSNLVSTIRGTSTVQLALGANNNEVIRINNSSQVGIGTVSPAFTADIAGDARVTSTNKMRFGGTAGTTNFYIQYNSTANSLDFVAG